jgi:caffeoyl-CoA O-methyltransferase
MKITNKQIADYCESFTSEEPEIVRELVKASEEDLQYFDMLSGRQVATLLKILVKISGAKRVLEVGTFTGYSALMMAIELPEDAELITLEMNERYFRISDSFFSKVPFKKKVSQIIGNALKTMPEIEGPFDLIFLDADKAQYAEYYKLAKQKSRPGGLIVLDNMLWDGEVLNGNDGKARAIHRTSEIIRDDEDVEQVMLPVKDGLTIVRVKD